MSLHHFCQGWKTCRCEGINLGEMDALLLKKIEELTLYVFELKKENDQLKKDILNLQIK